MLLRPGSPRPPLAALRRDPRTCGGKEGGQGRRGEGGARGGGGGRGGRGGGGGPRCRRNGKFDKSLQRPEEEGAGRSGRPAPPPPRPQTRCAGFGAGGRGVKEEKAGREMRGGAQERPRSVLPRFPPPGREVKAWGGGGGGGAQPPPPRPGAQRSSLLPTARLERRRRQQASLKEKEMIVSLACPRRRPQPGSWPGRLPRAPRPSPDTRSWPSVSAPSALAKARGPPCGARPGAPTAPAHPSSPPGLNPGLLPAAPPGPHSSPPAACSPRALP